MEDAGTSEEDDIDSLDFKTPIDHGHLARNCLIKIKNVIDEKYGNQSRLQIRIIARFVSGIEFLLIGVVRTTVVSHCSKHTYSDHS